MGLGLSRKTGTGSIPVWQGSIGDLQTYQGGFVLVTTGLAVGDVIVAGTPLVIDEAARTATPLRVGVAYDTSGGTATAYNVKKGHTLKVGDNLASGATGGKAYAITAIDTTTSTLYDILTVGTSIGAVTAGSTVYASTATGATASALPASNGLLYEETYIDVLGTQISVSAVLRGTVYARRVPYTTSIAALAGLKNIIYSQSY